MNIKDSKTSCDYCLDDAKTMNECYCFESESASPLKARVRLEELEKVVQTRDAAQGLHKFLEFSQPRGCLERLCKHEKSPVLLF